MARCCKPGALCGAQARSAPPCRLHKQLHNTKSNRQSDSTNHWLAGNQQPTTNSSAPHNSHALSSDQAGVRSPNSIRRQSWGQA
mmetsp:Transcript_18583/g.47070  ORF Transcript_18583/g.47070 Transcript_18583/m.47070 type:complete len:84 (+) Transcript_18583:2240-2491(+)